MSLRLYSFWRSQATYRVRIALAIKGMSYENEYVHLLKGEQFSDSYAAINPASAVPALVEDGKAPLIESLAILEYLEEKQPNPPLLPTDLRDRAHVRSVAQMCVVDIHPLIVPRVRKYLEQELRVDEQARNKWLKHWQETGSRALEKVLSRDRRTGAYCLGDKPTMADLCLVPHFTSAIMLYDCDLNAFPTCKRIFDNCMRLPAFADTHPTKQPDYAPGH
jgi:maleylpyruvate isomerase